MPLGPPVAGPSARLVALLNRHGPDYSALPGADALPAPDGACSLTIVSGPKAEAFVARLIAERLAVAAARIAEGGFALAAARVALVFDASLTADANPARFLGEDSDVAFDEVLFGEASGRLLIAAPDDNESMIDRIAIELGALDGCLMMGSLESGGDAPQVRVYRSPSAAPAIDLPLARLRD